MTANTAQKNQSAAHSASSSGLNLALRGTSDAGKARVLDRVAQFPWINAVAPRRRSCGAVGHDRGPGRHGSLSRLKSASAPFSRSPEAIDEILEACRQEGERFSRTGRAIES
jgi:hypothetical protein